MRGTRDIDRVDGEMLDECENDEEYFTDEVNGGFLDPEMVRGACVEELAGNVAMHVSQVLSVVLKTRWVDTNGDELSPEIRCWLVAKEVKKRNNTEEESANFFASTPPLEAVKFRFGSHDQESISKQSTIESEFL